MMSSNFINTLYVCNVYKMCHFDRLLTVLGNTFAIKKISAGKSLFCHQHIYLSPALTEPL